MIPLDHACECRLVARQKLPYERAVFDGHR
jgi:hypothetical protein